MTYELTDLEKLGILDQRLKQLEFGIYGAELDVIAAAANPATDPLITTSLDTVVTNLNLKKTALLTERATLE
jgi:hypothetical protein